VPAFGRTRRRDARVRLDDAESSNVDGDTQRRDDDRDDGCGHGGNLRYRYMSYPCEGPMVQSACVIYGSPYPPFVGRYGGSGPPQSNDSGSSGQQKQSKGEQRVRASRELRT
jgi:hypothetical protein